MKNLMITLFSLVATSAFAGNSNEFERGYNEGKSTCLPATSIVMCTAPSVGRWDTFSAVGRTREEALYNLSKRFPNSAEIMNKAMEEGKRIDCRNI